MLYEHYIQCPCQSRPGAADSALPYSVFAVTTDRSLEQSLAAVRTAPRLYTPSPYRTVNTLHLGYKGQSVNAVQWCNSCLFYKNKRSRDALPLHSMNSSGTFINTTYRHQFTVHEADLSSRHSNDIPFLLHSPLLIHTICQLLLATAMIYKLTFITFN